MLLWQPASPTPSMALLFGSPGTLPYSENSIDQNPVPSGLRPQARLKIATDIGLNAALSTPSLTAPFDESAYDPFGGRRSPRFGIPVVTDWRRYDKRTAFVGAGGGP